MSSRDNHDENEMFRGVYNRRQMLLRRISSYRRGFEENQSPVTFHRRRKSIDHVPSPSDRDVRDSPSSLIPFPTIDRSDEKSPLAYRSKSFFDLGPIKINSTHHEKPKTMNSYNPGILITCASTDSLKKKEREEAQDEELEGESFSDDDDEYLSKEDEVEEEEEEEDEDDNHSLRVENSDSDSDEGSLRVLTRTDSSKSCCYTPMGRPDNNFGEVEKLRNQVIELQKLVGNYTRRKSDSDQNEIQMFFSNMSHVMGPNNSKKTNTESVKFLKNGLIRSCKYGEMLMSQIRGLELDHMKEVSKIEDDNSQKRSEMEMELSEAIRRRNEVFVEQEQLREKLDRVVCEKDRILEKNISVKKRLKFVVGQCDTLNGELRIQEKEIDHLKYDNERKRRRIVLLKREMVEMKQKQEEEMKNLEQAKEIQEQEEVNFKDSETPKDGPGQPVPSEEEALREDSLDEEGEVQMEMIKELMAKKRVLKEEVDRLLKKEDRLTRDMDTVRREKENLQKYFITQLRKKQDEMRSFKEKVKRHYHQKEKAQKRSHENSRRKYRNSFQQLGVKVKKYQNRAKKAQERIHQLEQSSNEEKDQIRELQNVIEEQENLIERQKVTIYQYQGQLASLVQKEKEWCSCM